MEHEKIKKKKISKKRRKNAILYPIYKMFSWDLLSFYSVEFLFYTITKSITASEVLMLTSIYLISKVVFQIPAVAISDYFGKKKSIILGNSLLVIYMISLIFAPDFIWIAFANVFCAFGYDLKLIAEGNLLYDSVATKGGDGIYTKIDSKGASGYYILDTVLSIMAGYLFVINNYIPMCICLCFLIISLILSFKFDDIYNSKNDENKETFSNFIKGYSNDIGDSFKFIKKSNRMKSYLLFAAVFYGVIKIVNTYKNDLLIDIGVTEAQFAMIYAVMRLVSSISVIYSRKIQRYFKNKTLTFISLSYIISTMFIGITALILTKSLALPIILIFHTVIKFCDSQWYITEYTYLKNFTTPESRNKISFTFELITCVGASIMSIIGATILNYMEAKYAITLIGVVFFAILILILRYMKSRIGLKSSEYEKEDIEFTISKEI